MGQRKTETKLACANWVPKIKLWDDFKRLESYPDPCHTRSFDINTVKFGYNEQLGTGHFCSL